MLSIIRRRIFYSLKPLPSPKDSDYQAKMQKAYEEFNSQFTEDFQQQARDLKHSLSKEQLEKVHLVLDNILSMNSLELKVLKNKYRQKKNISDWNYSFLPREGRLKTQIEAEKGPFEDLGIGGYPAEFLHKLLSGELFEGITPLETSAPEEQEQKPQKTAFDLVLKGYAQDQKVKVIKAVKDAMNLGLKEAKERVESIAKEPLVLFKNVSKDSHQELADKLTAAGAQVEFE